MAGFLLSRIPENCLRLDWHATHAQGVRQVGLRVARDADSELALVWAPELLCLCLQEASALPSWLKQLVSVCGAGLPALCRRCCVQEMAELPFRLAC